MWEKEYILNSESETARLAERLAPAMQKGDVLLLTGELGAGKTSFARALIRALCHDATLEVVSPTFLMLQEYDGYAADHTPLPIVHADLYRVRDPRECDELGLEEAIGCGLVIVEWPDRGFYWPKEALSITFREEGGGRIALFSGEENWRGRLSV